MHLQATSQDSASQLRETTQNHVIDTSSQNF